MNAGPASGGSRVLARLFARQSVTRENPAGGPELRRALGLSALIGVGLGTMLGGIFATIGVGAQSAGPAVIVSFLLSGLACAFVSVCYAELASMVRVAGSAYTYAYATLGEVVAWIIGWDLLLEYGVSVAPSAASWSGAMQGLLQSANLNLPAWAQTAHVVFARGRLDVAHSQIDVLAFGIVLALTALLVVGIRESSLANGILVVVQVVAMLAFVAFLGGAVKPQHLRPFAPLGWTGVVHGAALVFFAYIGFDTVTVASEEARRPHRDVPLAVILSLAFGAVLYVAIAYVTVGNVPWRTIDTNAGMTDAVKHGSHSGLLLLVVSIGALAGTTTIMLTSLLGQIRIFYVMARDRMLPEAVARIHPRTQTPAFTTLFTGIAIAVLAAAVPLDVLLSMVNIGTLSAFAIVCAGVVALRLTQPELDRPFRAPLGIAAGVLGAGLCLYLMTGLEAATWIRFVVWFAVGLAIYAGYGYRRSRLRPGG